MGTRKTSKNSGDNITKTRRTFVAYDANHAKKTTKYCRKPKQRQATSATTSDRNTLITEDKYNKQKDQ